MKGYVILGERNTVENSFATLSYLFIFLNQNIKNRQDFWKGFNKVAFEIGIEKVLAIAT